MTKEEATAVAEEDMVLLKECYYYWRLQQLQQPRPDLRGLHLWIEAGYCYSTRPTFGHVNVAALSRNLHEGHYGCCP